MSTAAAFPDPEEVLQHLDWVRGLALHLVGDAAEADDLRQEVWVLSQRLNRPARIPLRGWLMGILRNKIRDRRRAANTRSYHEQSSALERAQAVHEPRAVRQASIHQVVVERLMNLREPYRSTLLARYFEDLTPAEIAEREGLPLATVRSRLQRGLAELRADLDQKDKLHGSVLALLALHTWSSQDLLKGATAAGSGVSIAAAAGVALVVGASLGVWLGWYDGSPAKPQVIPPIEVAVAMPKAAPQVSLPSTARQTLAETQPASQSEPMPVATAGTLPVSIIDLDGQPIPGEEVLFLRFLPEGGTVPGPFAITDGHGRAVVEGVTGSGMIFCPRTRNRQLAFPNAGEESPPDQTLVVVLAPSTLFEGTVRSAGGEPIQGARVRLAFLEPFPGDTGRHLAHANQAEFKARSDANGRFSIKVAKCSQAMGLICEDIGFQTVERNDLLFETDPAPMSIVLQPVQDPNICFGTMHSETGEPLADAWIGDGTRVERSGEEGRFQIGPMSADAVLWAGAPGHLPQAIGRPKDVHDLEVTLLLGDRAIGGRVVGPDGQGIGGWQVRLRTKQPVGDHYFAYGGRTAFVAMAAEDFAYPAQATIPGRAMGITQADGSFRLSGLLPQEYTLEVFDPASLMQIEDLRFAAGSQDVLIECPAAPGPVSGWVSTPEGQPLAGVLVRTLAAGNEFRQGPQVRSNEQGEFHLESLVRGCRIQADVAFPLVHVGTTVQGVGPVVCTAESAARVRLSLDLSQSFVGQERMPESAQFVDASGQVVTFVVDDIRYYRHDQLPITHGENGAVNLTPMIVPTRARELVFMDRDGPIHRIPLSLEAGQELPLSE